MLEEIRNNREKTMRTRPSSQEMQLGFPTSQTHDLADALLHRDGLQEIGRQSSA